MINIYQNVVKSLYQQKTFLNSINKERERSESEPTV
jgi:heme exporter protein D